MSYTLLSMRGLGAAPLPDTDDVPPEIDAACPVESGAVFNENTKTTSCVPFVTNPDQTIVPACPSGWEEVGSSWSASSGVTLGKCIDKSRKSIFASMGVMGWSMVAVAALVGLSVIGGKKARPNKRRSTRDRYEAKKLRARASQIRRGGGSFADRMQAAKLEEDARWYDRRRRTKR